MKGQATQAWTMGYIVALCENKPPYGYNPFQLQTTEYYEWNTGYRDGNNYIAKRETRTKHFEPVAPRRKRARKEEVKLRRDKVCQMRRSGLAFDTIGEHLNITRQRAYQIYHAAQKAALEGEGEG